MDVGWWMMDVFFNAKNARIFFIKLKLMSATALRSAKGGNIFGVDELMTDDG